MNIVLVDQSSYLSALASAQELLTSGVYFYHFLPSDIELLPTKSFTIPLRTFRTRQCKDQEIILGVSLNSCKGLNSPHISEVHFSPIFFLFQPIIVLYTGTLSC